MSLKPIRVGASNLDLLNNHIVGHQDSSSFGNHVDSLIQDIGGGHSKIQANVGPDDILSQTSGHFFTDLKKDQKARTQRIQNE